jgi:hypothetical protein
MLLLPASACKIEGKLKLPATSNELCSSSRRVSACSVFIVVFLAVIG